MFYNYFLEEFEGIDLNNHEMNEYESGITGNTYNIKSLKSISYHLLFSKELNEEIDPKTDDNMETNEFESGIKDRKSTLDEFFTIFALFYRF